ncbi:hypothetical protein [Halobaculum limi]|uniref:hypothetical protein n=1 Tax=Halobaculum limi TaxID=3031916 RepID=UPI0024064A96|nr:hypothetical protein [Halobaculum sp. YSMS11]
MHRDRTAAGDEVRATLRALALGTVPTESTDRDEIRRLVSEAETALASVEAASEVAQDGGFERLRAAQATTLQTAMPPSVVRRARRVLATLDRYRDAHRTATADADHFHSGHDTHIPRGEQRRDN